MGMQKRRQLLVDVDQPLAAGLYQPRYEVNLIRKDENSRIRARLES
jgi:hypothetical protein